MSVVDVVNIPIPRDSDSEFGSPKKPDGAHLFSMCEDSDAEENGLNASLEQEYCFADGQAPALAENAPAAPAPAEPRVPAEKQSKASASTAAPARQLTDLELQLQARANKALQGAQQRKGVFGARGPHAPPSSQQKAPADPADLERLLKEKAKAAVEFAQVRRGLVAAESPAAKVAVPTHTSKETKEVPETDIDSKLQQIMAQARDRSTKSASQSTPVKPGPARAASSPAQAPVVTEELNERIKRVMLEAQRRKSGKDTDESFWEGERPYGQCGVARPSSSMTKAEGTEEQEADADGEDVDVDYSQMKLLGLGFARPNDANKTVGGC